METTQGKILPLVLAVVFTFILGCMLYLTRSIAKMIPPTPTIMQAIDDTVQAQEGNFDRFLEWLGITPMEAASNGRQITQQDKAALLARQGNYDQALVLLEPLYMRNPKNLGVARDYASVLSWAGQHQKAVDVFEKLPAQEPNYVLAALAHSYRVLGQNDKALLLYQQGLRDYPDNVIFTEGEIRCLEDSGDLSTALSRADGDLTKHGNRPEIVAAKQDVIQAILRRDDQKAVELARQGQYPAALNMLQNLHAQYDKDVGVTQDYLAVLGWTGGHDADVVALYKSLPDGDQPDYVLEAVGHAYRQLKKPADAELVYSQGLQKYPDNVVFAEGRIRSMVDQHQYKTALVAADDDLKAHGNRPEIVDIRKNVLRLMGPAKKAHASRRHHRA